MQREVIVIGGGIAGLQCARELHRAGRQPLVLDRARGVGGRCATRRYEGQPIDFGPMFLHGHAEPFLQSVMDVDGVLLHSAWPRVIQGHGQPCQPNAFEVEEQRAIIPAGLNAFAKHLSSGLEIVLRTRVDSLRLEGAHFVLRAEGGVSYACRDLVLAMAMEEILELVGTLSPRSEVASIHALLGLFASVPSLTLLAAYPLAAPAPDWDLLYPDDSECLQLIAQDSRKREEPRFLTLVIQARPRWSRERLEHPEAVWAAELLQEAAQWLGPWVLEPLWTSPHRWRYARVDRGNELARPMLTRFPEGPRLGLAGDVFAPGGGVQAAWLSGSALAQRLLNEA
jgi:hypothetical protein